MAIDVIGMSCRFRGKESISDYWDLLASPTSTEPLETLVPDETDLDEAEFLLAAELIKEAIHDSRIEDFGDRNVGIWLARSRYRPGRTATRPLASRLARKFKIDGPALEVDSNCASALVAVAEAHSCVSSGLCDLAVVVAVRSPSTKLEIAAHESEGHLSKIGTCRPFAADSDGYALGAGGGAVVLAAKSETSLHAYGSIVGSACGQLGEDHPAFSLGLESLRKVLSRFLDRFGLVKRAAYLEAHALGSRIADEMEVLCFSEAINGRQLVVGAVKQVVGNLEAASGMAALQKVLLMARNRSLIRYHGLENPLPCFDEINARLWTASTPSELPGTAIVTALGQNGSIGLVAVEPSVIATGDGRQPLGPSSRGQVLLPILAGALALESNSIRLGASLFDLGLDSRIAIKIASEVRESLSIKLNPSDLFRYHKIEDLLRHVDRL